MSKRNVDCPNCLGSSGIVADGKGTTCHVCNGKGRISKRKENEFNAKLIEL